MSLLAALFSGVSGLDAYSGALGIISDNIVNINTVGYKETRARFTTLVTESGSSTTYSPGGVQSLPQNLISHQGLLQSSSSATDLSIDGAGFFVVTDNPNSGTSTSTSVSFTRAGSFTPDASGLLRNTAGFYILGFPLDASGNPPVTSEVGDLQPINVSDLTGTAEPTTAVSLRANLQSTQVANSVGYAAGVAGTSIAGGGFAPNFQRNVSVFDSLGGAHTITITALKDSANVNEWFVELYVDPPTDIVAGPGLHSGQIASGKLVFNTDGTIDAGASSAGLQTSIPVAWTGGASAGNITFDFGTDGGSDGFTQFDSTSTLISSEVNGAVFGSVTGVSIDQNGIVTAVFDNGLTLAVAQLPIAVFQNPDGLTRKQGNSYTLSDRSGQFQLQIGGLGGAGFVAPSTLEASTVDLAKEFTQLITTQRAFSASTKIITTADEMLEELNRIVR